MKIEHVAFNVPDVLAMARWYVDHLGFTVKRREVESPYAHFLADDSGQVMIELYQNPNYPIPDYHAGHVMSLHLALVSRDVEGDVRRLEQAGAKQEGETLHAPSGDVLAMLRDPWGFAVQLVQRAQPMI